MKRKKLTKKRLEWLNRVCREAKELGFGSLGELVAFMFDHACDIQVKEGVDSGSVPREKPRVVGRTNKNRVLIHDAGDR